MTKQENTQPKNLLTGKWHMVCWKANTADGWKQISHFSDNQFTWEFQSKGILTEGVLIETMIGEYPTKTEYHYYPEENMLAIDRSDYADDGYMLACIEEHYRIDFLSDRYIVLYDLEDVRAEPDDFSIKLELEKI